MLTPGSGDVDPSGKSDLAAIENIFMLFGKKKLHKFV